MDYEQEDWFAEKKPTHRWLNVLLIFILAALILGGGYYALKYVKNMSSIRSKTPQVTIKKMVENGDNEAVINEIKTQPDQKEEQKSPSTVVKDFYEWHTRQQIKPGDKKYERHEGIHPDLIPFVDRELVKVSRDDYDPFVCSVNKPASYEVFPEKRVGSIAEVMMNVHFERITPIKLKLKKLNDQWKIFMIECFDPESPLGWIENIKKTTDLDYVRTLDITFQWNQINDKSNNRKKLTGYGFKTENAKVKPGFIADYFTDKGFTASQDNENGYQNKNTACIIIENPNEKGHLNLSVMCAEK